MKRREFITLLGGAVAWPLAGQAQPVSKTPEVGFLYTGSASALPSRIAAFTDGLRTRDYIEGRNVRVITRTDHPVADPPRSARSRTREDPCPPCQTRLS